MVCLGPTVISSLPWVPPTQLRLCLTYTGMATYAGMHHYMHRVEGVPYLATTAYVVRHKAEVTIRRDKAEDAVTLPLLVPHTGVEGDIIKQPKDDGKDDTDTLLKIIPGVHE